MNIPFRRTGVKEDAAFCQVLCQPHLSRGGGHVLGATLPDPGPKYRPGSSSTIHFNHCSTVTVNLEPTHPTNYGHIPATLPDDADSSKFESEAVAAPLFSTQVDPFHWIWRRGPILKAQLLAALLDDTNLSTRTSSAPLASAIPHTTRWLSPLQDAPAPSIWGLHPPSRQ